jgi:glycine/D-amino acid oxidase-like deaminating enzyme
MKQQDLIIIGGGIMGLMTAYYASDLVENITILEKKTIGKENKEASSFSYTRSIRSDYPDEFYTMLAYEAQKLWRDLQTKSREKFYIECGCINIAKKSVTPDLAKTYAGQSYATRTKLKLETKSFNKATLIKRFPQFNADFGSLEETGGYLLLQIIKDLLLDLLKQRKVTIKENVIMVSLSERNRKVVIRTKKEDFIAEKVAVTSGRFVNDVVGLVKNNTLQFPITPFWPKESKYYYPKKAIVKNFFPDKFPVFAYLDAGIYGHPIFDEKKGAIKIGYYQSPEIKEKRQNKIKSVAEFVNECLPDLKNSRCEDITDVDQCAYDLVPDNEFILGKLPGYNNIVIGTGWRGTGYKYAPLIGKIISQLTLQSNSLYDIKRFSPERFVKRKSEKTKTKKSRSWKLKNIN